MIRKTIYPLLILTLGSISLAQDLEPMNRDTGSVLRSPEIQSRPAAVKYQSDSRRDPFLNLIILRQQLLDNNQEISRGAPPPGIAGAYIAQVVFKGTSLRERGRTAVFQGPDKRAYFLEEGDRFFDGYLKRIDEDSVLMVRETHMRSGEVRTEDVIQTLRTP